MNRICLNGNFFPADEPVIKADNKSYRYGEGLFETMRCVHHSIPLIHLHMERLFSGMQLLGFRIPPHFNQDKLTASILKLTKLNQCSDSARIRLSISGGHGGLNDGSTSLDYLVECWPIPPAAFNENGLVTAIFPDGRKPQDSFSNLKSTSHLLYAMAAKWAQASKLNEAIILNTSGRVAEAALSNLFIVADGQLITPPLSEGCVAGTMRKYLCQHLQIREQPLTPEDLMAADELFFTNAIHGIKWVGSLGNKTYGNATSSRIYREMVRTIWL